jgi:hypothetical protein
MMSVLASPYAATEASTSWKMTAYTIQRMDIRNLPISSKLTVCPVSVVLTRAAAGMHACRGGAVMLPLALWRREGSRDAWVDVPCRSTVVARV